MRQSRRGQGTQIFGTVIILLGLALLAKEASDQPNGQLTALGAVLAVGGFLMRIEAAVLSRGGAQDEAARVEPQDPRPWKASTPSE